jgi:hypothetical protein
MYKSENRVDSKRNIFVPPASIIQDLEKRASTHAFNPAVVIKDFITLQQYQGVASAIRNQLRNGDKYLDMILGVPKALEGFDSYSVNIEQNPLTTETEIYQYVIKKFAQDGIQRFIIRNSATDAPLHQKYHLVDVIKDYRITIRGSDLYFTSLQSIESRAKNGTEIARRIKTINDINS